jgi:hypothetical protein
MHIDSPRRTSVQRPNDAERKDQQKRRIRLSIPANAR